MEMLDGGGAARVRADDNQAARGMRQESADALEEVERPSRADQEIEQQQDEHHGRRARNIDWQNLRRQLDGESREDRGEREAQAFRQSGVAPYPAIDDGDRERRASDCHEPS